MEEPFAGDPAYPKDVVAVAREELARPVPFPRQLR
jgi:hypothetical protein